MTRYLTWLLCAAWLLPAAAAADLAPAKGRLLVATEEVRGEIFAETVILLLAHDESGAMGLVVNRPTEVGLEELLEETEAIAGYRTTVYWGGPVEMDSLSALANSGASAEAAEEIVTSVYRVPFDAALEKAAAEPASTRFYLGYAGWAPGQLDHELARGSWLVLPGSGDIVFADDPKRLWERLRPIDEYVATTRAYKAATVRLD
jgi:putative transcriptional regulator